MVSPSAAAAALSSKVVMASESIRSGLWVGWIAVSYASLHAVMPLMDHGVLQNGTAGLERMVTERHNASSHC
ncbi:MAG: hypothetical protein ACON4T_01565 [Synechococcus sp.]